eukprot:scaffold16979_cov21-Tisochrysis_lutea.AAC.2
MTDTLELEGYTHTHTHTYTHQGCCFTNPADADACSFCAALTSYHSATGTGSCLWRPMRAESQAAAHRSTWSGRSDTFLAPCWAGQTGLVTGGAACSATVHAQ